MLHFHDLAFFRADEAYGVVSVKALVNATEFLGGSLSVVGRSVHGNQVVELISSVDVQQLADRAEPVRRGLPRGILRRKVRAEPCSGLTSRRSRSSSSRG